MRYVLTVVIAAVVVGAGALLYAWSGAYNIAATEPHWGITSSFIEMLRDRSIEVRSEDIGGPARGALDFGNAAVSHYHEMCRYCHGAPGYRASEYAEGLYPSPPDMTTGHIQEEWGDGAIFWIAKHGIKMTGMPAFGPTHTDEDLWELVALVDRIPEMSQVRYQRLVREAASEMKAENGHTHGGTQEKESEDAQGHGHGETDSHGDEEQDHH